MANSPKNPIQSKIIQDVERRGWSWVWVFDPDGLTPSFAYTVGFTKNFAHPEVVVVGLPEETSHGILEAVFVSLEAGVRYADGSVSTEVLEGFPVRFGEVPLSVAKRNLVQAFRYYAKDVDALQLLWPEGGGKFPGDSGAPDWLNMRQKLQ